MVGVGVVPVLLGSRSFSAFGLTSVEVIRKKISSRNTKSVIEDIAVSDKTFVVLLNAIDYFSSSLPAGSCRRSIKSIVAFSIINIRLEI